MFWRLYNVLLHFPMLQGVQNENQVGATLAPPGRNNYEQIFKMAARSVHFHLFGQNILKLFGHCIMKSIGKELRVP